jgi:hypothetical protein
MLSVRVISDSPHEVLFQIGVLRRRSVVEGVLLRFSHVWTCRSKRNVTIVFLFSSLPVETQYILWLVVYQTFVVSTVGDSVWACALASIVAL